MSLSDPQRPLKQLKIPCIHQSSLDTYDVWMITETRPVKKRKYNDATVVILQHKSRQPDVTCHCHRHTLGNLRIN